VKIHHPVVAEFFYSGEEPDRQTDNEANSRFSQFCERAYKPELLPLICRTNGRTHLDMLNTLNMLNMLNMLHQSHLGFQMYFTQISQSAALCTTALPCNSQ
jgi:hypothetical protein